MSGQWLAFAVWARLFFLMDPKLAIEDNAEDVIGKAQRGLQWSDTVLAARAGIAEEKLREAKAGAAEENVWRALASVLGLDADALVALARKSWYPEAPELPAGFAMFTTPFGGDMTVNNYLVWNPANREAAVFDTGTNIEDLLARVAAEQLLVRSIFLTHTHPDHVEKLVELAAATGATVFTHEREPVSVSATVFSGKKSFACGGLTIRTRETWGHSPGMTTYVVDGLTQRLAVVGDAVFSGSMGGSVDFFAEQKRHNAEEIFTLPDDTILAPGHGPLTTVGWEKKHNPFFAGKSFSA